MAPISNQNSSLPWIPNFPDCRQFMDFYKKANMVDQEKMVEFYVHNLVLTNIDTWDPNSTMGDMQLMALASWIMNEDTREKEIRRVMRRINREHLHIRPELFNPRGVILNH